ncbi:putative 50 kDa protein in type I retrotransposable element R1DM [Bienertia sinuspersici]
MGNISVTKYYSKFIELSRFAQDIVTTEKQRARRFERGFSIDIQLQLAGQEFNTLDELYGRVAHLYTLEVKKKELTKDGDREKRKFEGGGSHHNGNQGGFKRLRFNNNYNFQSNFRGNKGNFGRPNPNPSKGNRGQTTNQQNRVYYCKKCSYNHLGRDCEGKPVTCNKCHKLGHREYECYSNDRTKGGPGGQPRGNFNGGQQRGFQGNTAGRAQPPQNSNANRNGNNGGQPSKASSPGKLNVVGRSETDANHDVIIGTFSIHSIPVKVLFDSGATYSFVSTKILQNLMPRLGKVDTIDVPIVIPTGNAVEFSKRYLEVLIKIEGVEFESNLIEFELGVLDVILGMD